MDVREMKRRVRENWKYINVLKKTFETGEKILNSEGKAMNIANVPDLFRTIITMFVLEWEEAHSFSEAKNRAFGMSASIKDINQIKFIVWSAMEEYFKQCTPK